MPTISSLPFGFELGMVRVSPVRPMLVSPSDGFSVMTEIHATPFLLCSIAKEHLELIAVVVQLISMFHHHSMGFFTFVPFLFIIRV